MASVTVRLFATVREAAGASHFQVDARDIDDLLEVLRRDHGTALAQLIDRYLSDPESLVLLINGENPGRASIRHRKLSSGDEIALFPPVSGG